MSRASFPMRQTAAAAAIALFAGAVAFVSPSDSDAAGTMVEKERRRQVLGRTVFVLAGVNESGQMKPVSSGSGTILTADGAVLTNHHVVWNPATQKPFDWIAIGIVTRFDAEPNLTCIATPSQGVLNEPLDLALVKCAYDRNGKPWRGTGWPVAEIGSSEDLIPGDEIIVIGFPGVGGNTISYTTGKVSGFLGKDGGSGRFWIKTDANISHGNSGGTAVDENGLLVGVPSAFNPGQDGDRIGLVRPIELARYLIKLAQSGWQPGQGSGAAGKTVPHTGGPPAGPPTGGPPTGGPPAGGPITGGPPAGGPITGGPSEPQPPDKKSGVTVVGKVVAVDSNEPIRNAFFVVLKPGVSASEIDEDNIGKKYLTVGITNAQGQFRTESPVPRGKRYSVIVFAPGFRPNLADGGLSTEPRGGRPVPDPFEPWDVIKLDRD
jgi:serine protease Do